MSLYRIPRDGLNDLALVFGASVIRAGEFVPAAEEPEAGWTDIDALINSAPYTSSRVVYVSSSLGNDGTGQIYTPGDTELGETPTDPPGSIAPYATLAGAWAQIRDGQADVMLMRRGDTWAANLYTNKAGASASARIIVADYGDPSSARPQVGALFPDAITTAGNQLLAHFDSAISSETATRGFTTRFEGVQFTGPDVSVTPVLSIAVTDGVDFVRCGFKRVRLFTFENIGRANMTFWDNVMWHPTDYVGAGGFEHNNYFQFDVGDIDSRRNISAQSPGVGFRQRGLGTVEGNLVLASTLASFDIGTNTYYGTGDPADRGTFLNMRYNLSLHGGGAYSLYDIRNATIEQNIFLADQYVTYWEDTDAVGNPPACTDVVLQDNIFYGSYIVQGAAHSGTITGPYLIRRNDFQRPAGGALIQAQSNDFTYEANNRFYSSSATSGWFSGYTSDYSAYVPGRGSNTQVTYTAPNRDLVSYMTSIGATPADADEAIEWFINGVPGDSTRAGAMNNRLGAWDDRFTATAVINHVREGFDLAALA
jgi:hypothetical protein